ncbi:hypothetical protein BCR34DRAFT_307312 [Clohesyomyces aquaticus]|uniref:Uncharacterized protein n=1 Tax=Clohesyomyces aquaticus TaxID=1231657 RepID=A0A1Y1ZP96_9PLEO|nr:hypothetical protein BCR34DRAFT_307312 [Clohesyomyces aquaticus]
MLDQFEGILGCSRLLRFRDGPGEWAQIGLLGFENGLGEWTQSGRDLKSRGETVPTNPVKRLIWRSQKEPARRDLGFKGDYRMRDRPQKHSREPDAWLKCLGLRFAPLTDALSMHTFFRKGAGGARGMLVIAHGRHLAKLSVPIPCRVSGSSTCLA